MTRGEGSSYPDPRARAPDQQCWNGGRGAELPLGQELHAEATVLLEPAVGLDGERPGRSWAALLIGEDPDHPGPTLDFLAQPFKHIGALQVFVIPEGQAIEGERL